MKDEEKRIRGGGGVFLEGNARSTSQRARLRYGARKGTTHM